MVFHWFIRVSCNSRSDLGKGLVKYTVKRMTCPQLVLPLPSLMHHLPSLVRHLPSLLRHMATTSRRLQFHLFVICVIE